MATAARTDFTRWNISVVKDPTALDRYREGLAAWYSASDFDTHALPRFFTDNMVRLFGAYVVGRGRSIGQTLVRGPREIRHSGMDGVILLLDLGGITGDIDGVSVRGRPGTVHVRHLSRPSASRVEAVDAITIALPREVAPPWLLEPRYHGAYIDGGSAVGRVLVNHMTALAAAAPQMSVPEGVASVHAALTLAEQAFRNSGRFSPDQARALYAGIRASATALIDQRLKDPEFNIGSLVSALGVSRATLFRAFPETGGINSCIRQQRLQSAREALIRRTGRRPTVAEIAHAHGFVSESHFSRLFSAAFGESPGAAGPGGRDVLQGSPQGDMRYDLVLGWIKGGAHFPNLTPRESAPPKSAEPSYESDD